jgi:hypothetical protein
MELLLPNVFVRGPARGAPQAPAFGMAGRYNEQRRNPANSARRVPILARLSSESDKKNCTGVRSSMAIMRMDRCTMVVRYAVWHGNLRALGTLTIVLFCIQPSLVKAQNLQTYFPSGVGGYDQQIGVTVVSRERPLFETPGILVGDFLVTPHIDQSLFYNSSIKGTDGSGSWGDTTSASVSAFSNWRRDSLTASAGLSNSRFYSLPGENYTNWNVGLSGGYTIGESQLVGGYSHQTYYQLGTAIGTARSDTPMLTQTDTGHVEYTFNLNRITITPDVSFSRYTFGPASLQGVQFNQNYLNRNVVAGGVTGHYSLSEEGGLLVVMRGTSSTFDQPLPGQPSNDSRGGALLIGADYQASGLWRYRFLFGVERDTFKAAQFPPKTSPITEGSVIWTPSGVVTVTGTLSREIEDPASADTNGYILTQARLVVDYEYGLNILLQGRGSFQLVNFLQAGGGSQTSVSAGAGANWLLSRNLRLSLDADITKQTSGGQTTAVATVGAINRLPYTQSLIALTLHVAF